MKNFLSIEKFKECKVLFIIEIFILLDLILLFKVNNLNINLWNWKAFVLSIIIWSLSTIMDKKTYFNLATLLGTSFFMYLFWFFVFNAMLFK
jgi:hypothetical protein